MSNTVWILNLPEGAKTFVEVGQKVSPDEVIGEKEGKKFRVPIKATVKKLNDKKVQFEFKTKKISGEGLNQLNSWGIINWCPDMSYSQLSSENKDQIIVMKNENFNSYLVTKAKALGVKGLIVFNCELQQFDWPIPVLVVSKSESKLIKKNNGVKCLLDASKNCLLIPEND